jgi:cyclophilin family peptidyl-prolyl cis-trans isomerase
MNFKLLSMKKNIFTLLLSCFSVALLATENDGKVIIQEKINKKMDSSTYVLISTEYGDIKIRLYNETPLHRDNFIKLAQEKFFDSTLFHRVIPTFMIQGGDPQSKTAKAGEPLGMGDVGYRVPAEFNKDLIHKRGVLAAARDGNPQKASSGCQFYITQGKKYSDEELEQIAKVRGITWTDEQKKTYKEIGGTPSLDMNYTVFGEVVSGIEVVDKIVADPRDPRDRPNKDIRMTVKVLDK